MLEIGEYYIRFYKDGVQITIDAADYSNFDPTAAYTVGQYTNYGDYIDFDFGASRHLYVAGVYSGDLTGLTVEIATNAADTLAVSDAGAAILVELANTTSTKNAANLIQTALRALTTVNGVDVTAVTVTENAAYTADRPIAGALGPTAFTSNAHIYQCTIAVTGTASNTSISPIAGGSWVEVSEGAPIEVPTPYADADIFELDCGASNLTVLYIFHTDYPIGKLTRTNDRQWGYSTITCGGKFASANNYPACGCMMEQRLWAFGTINAPNGVWASMVGSLEDFTIDAENPAAALDFSVLVQGSDQARWAFPENGIWIGTVGGVIKIYSTISGEAISQENVNILRITSIGVNNTFPEMVDDAVMFVTRMGTTVRRLGFEEGKPISTSAVRVASHIAFGSTSATSGIKQFAFQRDPFVILWAVRNDGQLLGMVYDIQDKLYGWFRVKLDGIIESVAVTGADGEEDRVWIVIKRTIEGVDKRYVEYFMPHTIYSSIANAFFVESGITYSGVSATVIPGLDHLKGEVVYCLGTTAAGSGRVQGPYTVSAAGTATLGAAITYGHIGKTYDSTLEPMKVHTTTDQGTTRGRRQKCNKVTVSLYETGQGVQIGPDTSNLKNLFLNDDEPDEGDLMTDDAHYDYDGDWDDKVTVVMRQSQPLPMTVLALIPRFVTEDED